MCKQYSIIATTSFSTKSFYLLQAHCGHFAIQTVRYIDLAIVVVVVVVVAVVVVVVVVRYPAKNGSTASSEWVQCLKPQFQNHILHIKFKFILQCQ